MRLLEYDLYAVRDRAARAKAALKVLSELGYIDLSDVELADPASVKTAKPKLRLILSREDGSGPDDPAC